MKRVIMFFLCMLVSVAGMGQEVMPLYNGTIPNSIDGPDKEVKVQMADPVRLTVRRVSRPTLEVFPASPKLANKTSVIICPGGAYSMLSYEFEGTNIARRFNDLGVTAFILKYRLPDTGTMFNTSVGPIEDLQQAIKIVREGAARWHIDGAKIGVMGFSAGGHLAATGATHFDAAFIANREGTSLRPDFLILIYPVISMTDSMMHKGSRNNLLGPTPTREKIDSFSNELHVTGRTPPTLLIQSGDDKVVTIQNSLSFYQALLRNSVPAEMHIYDRGDHGFLKDASVREQWFGNVANWMKRRELLK